MKFRSWIRGLLLCSLMFLVFAQHPARAEEVCRDVPGELIVSFIVQNQHVMSFSLDAFETEAVANSARGENRRVVVEVTEIVRYFLNNPTKNYGVVLGSLTRDRDGVFDIKAGTDGTLARLVFHYKPGRP